MATKTLQIDDTPERLRIVIPLRWQEKVFLLAATTVILAFGMGFSLFASYMMRQTELRQLWWMPLILSGVIVLLYCFCLVFLWFVPPTVFESDGQSLKVGTEGRWYHELRSDQIKSISVLRLPMVPIGTVVVQPRIDAQFRVGYWRKRELVTVVDRIRQRLELT